MAFYVLFMLLLDLLSTFEAAEVLPSAAYFPEPLPGDFSGVPTAPDQGCFVSAVSITCNNISKTVFTDGAVGDETGSLMPTSFHAWSDSSGFSLTHSTATVRQVKLFFYHEPSMGIGLPQFTLSASLSNIIPGSPSLDYTLLGNQDLSEDDATVRNVTLALTTTQSNEHFHIQFSLTNEIQQFAVSEVELCSDEATIEVEELSLVLRSEPLSGPDILLPANTSLLPSTATLTCTVANQGHFQWQWALQDSSSPSSVQVSDGTRISAIEILLGTDAVGDYTCTASYHPDSDLPSSPVTGIFTVQLERILTAVEETITIDGQSSVSLQCRLAGYVDLLSDDTDLIEWIFNGQKVISGGDNLITVGRPSCEYGKCVTSLLIISNLDSSDLGEYSCSFESLTQTVTLTSAITCAECPTPAVATFSPSSTPAGGCFVGSNGTVCSSISDTVFAGGEDDEDTSLAIGVGVGVGAGGAAVAVAVLVIIVGVTVVIRKTPKQTKEAPFYDYVTSPAPPERIQLEESVAYGSTRPQSYEVPVTSLKVQPNIAYGVVTH